MGNKEFIFDGKTTTGRRFFAIMLKLLDSSKRQKFNDARKLVQDSGIQPGQTVLEIGCGSGYFTVPAAKILGHNGKLISVDIHPVSVEVTQGKVDDLSLNNVIVRQEDAMHTSFDDHLFDLILLYGVIPAPFISIPDLSKEMARLLKPGGICAIWTMVPLWTPEEVLKEDSFEKLDKVHGVFRLRKITGSKVSQ